LTGNGVSRAPYLVNSFRQPLTGGFHRLRLRNSHLASSLWNRTDG